MIIKIQIVKDANYLEKRIYLFSNIISTCISLFSKFTKLN